MITAINHLLGHIHRQLAEHVALRGHPERVRHGGQPDRRADGGAESAAVDERCEVVESREWEV